MRVLFLKEKERNYVKNYIIIEFQWRFNQTKSIGFIKQLLLLYFSTKSLKQKLLITAMTIVSKRTIHKEQILIMSNLVPRKNVYQNF